jgi:hypothetical protein
MTRQQIEDLIKASVAEAKLQVAESRIKLLIWVATAIFALTGVVIPLWITGVSTAKVDKAIEDMKLATSQLRQADIKCLVNNRPIDNSTVLLDPQSQDFILEMQNLGSGPAYSCETFLYLDYKDTAFVSALGIGWYPHQISDDPVYKRQFEYSDAPQHFLPKRTWTVKLKVDLFKAKKVSIPAKLKIFSLDSGPWEFKFTITNSQ